MNCLDVQFRLQIVVQGHGELLVEPLVSRNQFVREGQARHEATLFEPKYSTKRTREEDALHASKRHEALCKRGPRFHPPHGPFRLSLNCGRRLYGPEQSGLLFGVPYELVDHERVRLGVDRLVERLVRVEGPSLGNLDIIRKVQVDIFHHNSIRGCKEGQDHLDEVLLVRIELVPILEVPCEVNLLDGPKGADGFLIQCPKVWVPYRKGCESRKIRGQDGVGHLNSPEVYSFKSKSRFPLGRHSPCRRLTCPSIDSYRNSSQLKNSILAWLFP